MKNQENLIPISYVKQFTPLAVGDVLVDQSSIEVVIDDLCDWNISSGDEDWYLVSFASRPNTGKRPVGDDVMVDMEYYYNHKDFGVSHWYAGQITWQDQTTYKSWKINHAAMLAKFKEQGANTMNAFTKKDMPTLKFYLKAGHALQSGDELLGSGGNVMKMAGNAKDWSESPTTDGKQSERVHVKSTHDNRHDLVAMAKTERYEITHAIALVTNALDDNPGEQVKEPESMIGSSEFYQSDNPQVIEQWVGDQLEDLINPVSEGRQADAGAIPGKPVFTQEAAALNQNPQVGTKCLIALRAGYTKESCKILAYNGNEVWVLLFDGNCTAMVKILNNTFAPIDNRTDDQKCFDDLNNVPRIFIDDVNSLISDIKAGKIHGVKWSL